MPLPSRAWPRRCGARSASAPGKRRSSANPAGRTRRRYRVLEMSPRDARRLNVPWSTNPVAIHVSTLGAVEEPLRLVEAAMNEGHGIGMLENHVLPFEPGCHMRRERNPAIAALVTPGAIVGTDENAG